MSQLEHVIALKTARRLSESGLSTSLDQS